NPDKSNQFMMLMILFLVVWPALITVLPTAFFCSYRNWRGQPLTYSTTLTGGLCGSALSMLFIGDYSHSATFFFLFLAWIVPPCFLSAFLIVMHYRKRS